MTCDKAASTVSSVTEALRSIKLQLLGYDLIAKYSTVPGGLRSHHTPLPAAPGPLGQSLDAGGLHHENVLY